MSILHLTNFIHKTKLTRESQKVASMSKLRLKEKLKTSKMDYFYVLSQIREKERYMSNSNLYYTFFENNSRNQDQRKIFNYKIQGPLITEPLNKKKNLSYKNISTNVTSFESLNKNILILNKKFSTPKHINQILKLDFQNKPIKKIKLKEKKVSTIINKDYKLHLEKLKKLNFYDHIYSNVEYAHNKRCDFLINKVENSLKKEDNKNKQYLMIEKEKLQNEKELRDKVPNPPLDMKKITKQIRNILIDEYKFYKIEKKEKFFENFENRINFIFDNYKPPHLINNLIKIKFDEINLIKNKLEWKWINTLGANALNYISRAKIKMQRERDEKMKFLMEKNKIKNKYLFYKKLSTNKIYNSKAEIEKIIYKNYYLKNDDDKIPEKETETLDQIFENENYFENKCDNITIANPKLRNFFFNNMNYKKNTIENNLKIRF